MRCKVELHGDIVWYLRTYCNAQERQAFYEQLAAVQQEPIRNSEFIFVPEMKPYMLRSFRFGLNKAVFEFDPAENRVRVLECRKLKPKRPPGNGAKPNENGP